MSAEATEVAMSSVGLADSGVTRLDPAVISALGTILGAGRPAGGLVVSVVSRSSSAIHAAIMGYMSGTVLAMTADISSDIATVMHSSVIARTVVVGSVGAVLGAGRASG